ncbi:MAG: hypothetical protein ACI9MC_000614 [Kiritimatiellia bacterium]
MTIAEHEMNAPIEFDANSPDAQKIRKQVLSRAGLSAFMVAKLPLAFVAGLRVTELDATRCSVRVPYRWRTTNPFRSTYFAALAMAAEMSTGALGLSLVRAAPVPMSILIVEMTGKFVKKATDVSTFTCEDGHLFEAAIIQALTSEDGASCSATTVGRNNAGEEVATFTFTWSFRKKKAR